MIAKARQQYNWSKQRLTRARWLYARLVRHTIDAATNDDDRREALWRAATKAAKAGLWSANIRKRDGYCKAVCYALLAIMFRIEYMEGKVSAHGIGDYWAKQNWLYENGWTACGEVSDKFSRQEANRA